MDCSDLLPFMVMVIVELGYAGVNIIATAVMGAGMNPFIHIAYQQIFATIALTPLAYFLERKSRPRMTPMIFFQIFLCSLFGLTGDQIAFFVGLNNSTPTVASSLTNLMPAITFVAAVLFRLESVRIKTKAGQAKVFGSLICIGGAMFLTLYRGPIVISQSRVHWKYAQNTVKRNNSSSHGNIILGNFMVILSACSYSAFLITQTSLSKQYPAPYSSTAIACFLASLQCVVIALCTDHNIKDWVLTPMRALSTTYNGNFISMYCSGSPTAEWRGSLSLLKMLTITLLLVLGIVYSALAICLSSWCIERKGPLYVAVFSPLLLVFTAILSWAFLREKIYTGTVVGSILIVFGLYIVLWGQKNELKVIHVHEDDKMKASNKKEAQEC